MVDDLGAEAIVLAGTDLNLAFDGQDPGYPVIDALDVHVARSGRSGDWQADAGRIRLTGMSKPTDNPADPFKKALAEATRTMADDPEMTVTYSVDPPGMTKEGVRLPQVSRRMTRDEVLLARGTADAFALRRKFHDEAVDARYAPTGPLARDIYDAMETARCEAVGARAMPGTAGNIDAKIAHEADRKGYGQMTQAADAPLAGGRGLSGAPPGHRTRAAARRRPT